MNFKSIIVPIFALTLLCFTVQQQAGIFNNFVNNFVNTCKNINFTPLKQTIGSMRHQTTSLFAAGINAIQTEWLNIKHDHIIQKQKYYDAQNMLKRIAHCPFKAPCAHNGTSACPSLFSRCPLDMQEKMEKKRKLQSSLYKNNNTIKEIYRNIYKEKKFKGPNHSLINYAINEYIECTKLGFNKKKIEKILPIIKE